MRVLLEKHLGKSATVIGLIAVITGYLLGADQETIDACLGILNP